MTEKNYTLVKMLMLAFLGLWLAITLFPFYCRSSRR